MKPTKQNKSILKKDEEALHFYCPKEDGMFTFIYQHDGKIYPFTHILPKEQEDDLFKLKLQFGFFAEGIYNSIHKTGKGD